MDKKIIYLDNAATTSLLPEVKQKMIDYMDDYGNPSSLYQLGVNNKEAIRFARCQIASTLRADPEEIIFTSSGSEANNFVIRSVFDMMQQKGNHIITSKIEHHSTLECLHYLEKYRGAEVTYLDVDQYGRIDPSDVGAAITPKTILITIMASNNEIGTLQNISSINSIAKSYDILYHADGVQSYLHHNLSTANFDFLSISSHKIGGPKGVGALYVKKGINLLPLISGTQENNKRGGTQNIIGIVGFGEATYYADKNMYDWNNYVSNIAYHFKNRVLNEIPNCHLNGHPGIRLSNNVNISFDGIRGEELLILLDMYGICVSTGSACNSSSNEPSHVLKAIGLSDEEANSSIRFTFSHENTLEEVDFAVDRLKELVERLRTK